jgi:hypothetical protein
MSREVFMGLAAVLWLTAAPARSHVESRPIRLPAIPGATAIWGATGADATGHIWLGVSIGSATDRSAHLVEYDPATDTAVDRGNVLEELKRVGLLRDGETQRTIQTRIVQVQDFLYFASTDQQGQTDGDSTPPAFGGHLWRMRLSDRRWEHLLRTPEALVAVAASARDVYALGYFDHVLYRYDVVTGDAASCKVGKLSGHVSHNLFVDGRGDVHVPRLDRFGKSTLSASLVEFDGSLREIATLRMEHYLEADLQNSRGIVAFHPVGERDVVFATGAGRLYRLVVPQRGDSHLEDLGPYDTSFTREITTMFLDDAGRSVWGVVDSGQSGRVDLITRSLTHPSSSLLPLPYGNHLEFPGRPRLYGSVTRDRQGWAYVVGALDDHPLALRVRVSTQD